MSAYEILQNRGVTRLCHFTKFNRLTQIITSSEGILASNSIRQDIKVVTDTARYDGELEYVCCSVEFPNSWFLRDSMKKDTDKIFKDWIVLYIDPAVLNIKNAKYCPCNASKASGRYICDRMETVSSIFARKIETFSYPRTPQMLSCCPTDGQAEILIKENIPRDYISGIAVGTKDVAGRIYSMLKLYDLTRIPIYLAPDVLSVRWSELVRAGKRPTEELCDWSEE